VADNQLTHISGLAHLHCLTVLNLANNSISAIEGESSSSCPCVFPSVTPVCLLDLFNTFVKICKCRLCLGLRSLRKLQWLCLSGNRIEVSY
jgi:Leucine-rich repeat (LRR) protein